MGLGIRRFDLRDPFKEQRLLGHRLIVRRGSVSTSAPKLKPEIDVGDAQGVEPPGQRRPTEMGQPGREKRSNVGNRADVRRREQCLEFGPVVGRVADGPNGGQP